MILVKGDRVKLADAVIRSKLMRRHHYVDWAHRQGTVIGVSRRRIKIMWDGRTSADMLVPKAVERIVLAGVATTFALVLALALPRTPAADPILIAEAIAEERFDEAWIDVMRPLALKNADLERTAYTVSAESKPVVTERSGTANAGRITPAPDGAPASMPPVVVVQDEDEPPAPWHRRQRASNGTGKINMPNICTRHHMHKVMIRGGKSWRCRK
jgi:hypothetical protein